MSKSPMSIMLETLQDAIVPGHEKRVLDVVDATIRHGLARTRNGRGEDWIRGVHDGAAAINRAMLTVEARIKDQYRNGSMNPDEYYQRFVPYMLDLRDALGSSVREVLVQREWNPGATAWMLTCKTLCGNSFSLTQEFERPPKTLKFNLQSSPWISTYSAEVPAVLSTETRTRVYEMSDIDSAALHATYSEVEA